MLGIGWRNRYHEEWVNQYKQRYFSDIIELSTKLPFLFFQFFYDKLRPMDTDY